ARTWRLVHLAEYQHGVVENACGAHIADQFLRFSGTFADAAEDRDAPMTSSDIVDQLRDEHGLADARAAEQPRLAAALQRSEQVDRLDTRDEDFRGRALIGQ